MNSITTLKNKILSILTLGVVSLSLALPTYGMSHLIASDPTPSALKDTEPTPNSHAIHNKFLGAIAQNRSIPNSDVNGNCYKIVLAGMWSKIANEAARQMHINMKKAATFLTDYDMAHDLVSFLENRKDIMANFGKIPFLAYHNESSRKHYVTEIYNIKKRKSKSSYPGDLDYEDLRKLMLDVNLIYVAIKLDETNYCAKLRL